MSFLAGWVAILEDVEGIETWLREGRESRSEDTRDWRRYGPLISVEAYLTKTLIWRREMRPQQQSPATGMPQQTLKDQGTISGTYPILPKSVSNGRITEVTLIAGEPIQLVIRFTPARPSTQPAQPQRQNGIEATTSPSFWYANVSTVKCKRRILEMVRNLRQARQEKQGLSFPPQPLLRIAKGTQFQMHQYKCVHRQRVLTNPPLFQFLSICGHTKNITSYKN